MEGAVVAVGPGARDEKGQLVPLDLKAGDRILFGKWSGTEAKIDGEELPDHEGERHPGRSRGQTTHEAGCLSFSSILVPRDP